VKQSNSSRRLALLGGAGFIGRNLAEALRARGHGVVVVDPSLPAAAPPGSMQLDLAQRERLQKLLQVHEVDTVIHLASLLLPGSDAAAFEREIAEVLAPSFALMDYCARASIRVVVFSSGGTVYGDPGPSVVHESQPLAPKSRYGLAKVMLEEYARLCQRSLGLRCIVLRPSNPYGRHQRLNGAQGLVAVALGKALAGEPLEVWGDGEAVRDYVDVRDLADAVVQLIESDMLDTTLNIGSGVGHSVNEVVELVRRVTGLPLTLERRPARSVDVRRVVLDTHALAAAIRWRPTPLEEGLRAFHREVLSTHGA
jgi:UDP-glucose 4-epimerase